MDANFNRAREGLRVCEEFARFFLNSRPLTEEFKKIRRKIGEAYNSLPYSKKFLFSARDTASDVARKGFDFEKKRSGTLDVFWANLQRTKEALRVLEEFTKLTDERLSDDFKKLRFRTYCAEKQSLKKLHNRKKK